MFCLRQIVFQSKILTAAPLIFRLANDVDKTNKPFVLKSAYVSSLYQARTNIEYETGASFNILPSKYEKENYVNIMGILKHAPNIIK